MIMVIIIGNQKGGAGKSTITLLLANFLTQVRKCRVIVIDMDFQQSVMQKFDRARLLENAEPYLVIAAVPGPIPVLQGLGSGLDQLILIDFPGRLEDDRLIPVVRSADLVICPFAYDESSFESTVLFSIVMKKINPEMEITYIPNRIKANVGDEIRQEVDAQLSRIGRITPVIPDRIGFQHVNTFQTPLSVQALIAPVFEQLWRDHLDFILNERE
jgi:chromosome partitioning protein